MIVKLSEKFNTLDDKTGNNSSEIKTRGSVLIDEKRIGEEHIKLLKLQKQNSWLQLPYQLIPFVRQKCNIVVNLYMLLSRYSKFLLLAESTFFTQPSDWKDQSMAPNITVFQVLKKNIQYMASHPHKTIFYPSN